MTTYINDITKKELIYAMSPESIAILIPDDPELADVLLTDNSGQSVFDVSANGDDTEVWGFLENALQSDAYPAHAQMWQQNPYPSEWVKPDPSSILAEPTETHSALAKMWLGGGVATVALLAGVAIGQHGGNDEAHHHDTPPPSTWQPHATPLPQPMPITRAINAPSETQTPEANQTHTAPEASDVLETAEERVLNEMHYGQTTDSATHLEPIGLDEPVVYEDKALPMPMAIEHLATATV